jgi:hypothetical protein
MHFYPVAPEIAAERRGRYERAARRRRMVSGVDGERHNRRRGR